MILSLKHRFIFIKGRKVGGTSVEMALSKICGPEDIITPITPIDEKTRLRNKSKCQNYSDSLRKETDYLDFIKNLSTSKLGSIKIPKEKFYNHMSLNEVAERFTACSLDNFFIFLKTC